MDRTPRPPVEEEEGINDRRGKAAAAGVGAEKRKKSEGSSGGDDRHVNDGLPGRTRSSTRRSGDKTEVWDDEILPLSGKPFFSVVISRAHVKPKYMMPVPVKMQAILPSEEVPAVLMCNGKEWRMVYMGAKERNKRFSGQFKDFVDDNDLKVDDACVFELMACTESELRFRVQILRGDLPPVVQAIIGGQKRDRRLVRPLINN